MSKTRVVPFRQRPSTAGEPADTPKEQAASPVRADDGRRGRAVRFFRDIHGTERIWRRIPALQDFVAGGDHIPAYGLVVCTNRRGANAR